MKIGLLQFYSHAPAPDYAEMSAALRSMGHTVWLATPAPDGALVWSDGEKVIARHERVQNNGDRHGRLPGSQWLGQRLGKFWFILRVRKFLLGAGCDVVQVNPFAYDPVLTIGLPRSTCCILDVRQAGEVGGGGFRGRLRNWKIRVGLRVSARLFFDHSCFATRAAAARVLGPGWQRFGSVHPVGQHPSFLDYQWGQRVPGQNMGRVRFIYVGSISRVRKLERLLEAVRMLMDRSVGFHLDLMGADHAGGFYQDMAEGLGVREFVRFCDPVPYSQVAAAVSEYDVALAYAPREPDWEVQPTLKVLEFRALGMPIIATESTPNRAVVTDGENGLLVGDDAVSIAGGMLRFINDPGFLQASSMRARAMRHGRTWMEVAAEYQRSVYIPGGLLSGRGLRRFLRSHTRKGV